jgi:hypothetical protein
MTLILQRRVTREGFAEIDVHGLPELFLWLRILELKVIILCIGKLSSWKLGGLIPHLKHPSYMDDIRPSRPNCFSAIKNNEKL